MPNRAPAQPIKRIAYARGVTQQQFAIDNRLPYLLVHRVFNGRRPPSDKFVEMAVRRFGLPERRLFRPRPGANGP